jgi:hypothetical protein
VLDAYARVLAEVDMIVAAVTADRFDDHTPCADWNVRALLDHLVYENLMWTSLADGDPRNDFAADHLGDDHVAAFRASAEAALAAFRRPGMLAQQYGPTDLAPDVAATALAAVRTIYAELPRTPGGSFAPAQPVPDRASAADRLAAYLGRDVNWTPPG